MILVLPGLKHTLIRIKTRIILVFQAGQPIEDPKRPCFNTPIRNYVTSLSFLLRERRERFNISFKNCLEKPLRLLHGKRQVLSVCSQQGATRR